MPGAVALEPDQLGVHWLALALTAGAARGYRLEEFVDAFARYTCKTPSKPGVANTSA
jgi:hypothetical protein